MLVVPTVPTVSTVSGDKTAGANLGGLHRYHSNNILSHGVQRLLLAIPTVEVRQDMDLIKYTCTGLVGAALSAFDFVSS